MKTKVALVTGASKGIGEQIVNLLKPEYYLVLLGRDENKLKEICFSCNEQANGAEYMKVDLTDYDMVAEYMRNLLDRIGHIDLLINCAGVGSFSKVTEISMQDFKRCMDVNVNAICNLTTIVAEKMKNKRAGQIINISSIAGVKGFCYGAGYVTSKFALEGFTQVLWEEMKKYEVKVCTVRSGLVDTSFYNKMELDSEDKKRLQEAPDAKDLAQVIYSIVNQPERMNISEITVRPIKQEAQRLFTDILEKNV